MEMQADRRSVSSLAMLLLLLFPIATALIVAHPLSSLSNSSASKIQYCTPFQAHSPTWQAWLG